MKAREELARQREETARRLEAEYEQRLRDRVEKYDSFVHSFRSIFKAPLNEARRRHTTINVKNLSA